MGAQDQGGRWRIYFSDSQYEQSEEEAPGKGKGEGQRKQQVCARALAVADAVERKQKIAQKRTVDGWKAQSTQGLKARLKKEKIVAWLLPFLLIFPFLITQYLSGVTCTSCCEGKGNCDPEQC